MSRARTARSSGRAKNTDPVSYTHLDVYKRQVLAYAKTKPARDGLKAQKSEKARAAYRQANESDFIIAEAAARYFKLSLIHI